MTPHEALSFALRDHLEVGNPPPPCSADPERWTGDDATARAFAAMECIGACPLLTPCRTAGLLEDHGVWGGIDRTRGGRRRTA